MPPETLPSVPRRELNRSQTWESIHLAASELVLRNGLADATVDAIAQQANVSRRTFFNYFASKEDAVLGMRPAELSAADVDAFDSSSEDTFGRVVRLVHAAIGSTFHDPEAFLLRRELLKRSPELRGRLDQHLRDAENLVQSMLAEKGFFGTESSRAVIVLAGAVMRFAFSHRPDGTIDNRPEAIDAAITLFRETLKEVL